MKKYSHIIPVIRRRLNLDRDCSHQNLSSPMKGDSLSKLGPLLQETIPALGFVLDCCTKPSHDLGRSEYFHCIFGEMNKCLVDHWIHTVLTACPNCTKIFRQYARGLAVRTVYDIIHGGGNTKAENASGISVHESAGMSLPIEPSKKMFWG
jgi:hypothetical protein